MATLLQAADIIEAMRSETAQLDEEGRVRIERTRLTAIRSLHARDSSIIAASGSTDGGAKSQAETDWRGVTGEWERELEGIQTDLFRAKSPELAVLHMWALTRLHGGRGLRCGVEVIAAVFETFAPGVPAERWETLPSLDLGDRDDVLPRALGRSLLLADATVLGARTSIDRVDRMMRGEQDATVASALEQEVSALTDDQIRAREALYRESGERIVALRKLAAAAGVEESEGMLEASRTLLASAAKVIRQKAPDQFAPEPAAGGAPPKDGPGAGGSGAQRTDFAASEDGYIAARERKFRELEAIGAWFRRFEPHNPIGHVVPPLIKRAGMDLPGLLASVFEAVDYDEKDVAKMFRYLAVQPPEKKQGSSG